MHVGVFCNICFVSRESIETEMILHSSFILIKHRVLPMDLVLIEQLNTRIFSFLSVSWGLFADIDYESEKYRAIGEARFTLQAIKRILGKNNHCLIISFPNKTNLQRMILESIGKKWGESV